MDYDPQLWKNYGDARIWWQIL